MLSALALLGAWWLLAAALGDPQILPEPQRVFAKMAELWHADKIQADLMATMLRVAVAFVLAMLAGGVLGYLMGRSQIVNAWLDPWLLVFLNLPALVLIVLCYLWIGLNETAAIFAVTLNKIPLVTTIMREGSRSMQPQHSELAKVYKLSFWSRLRHFTLPELYPAIIASARAGFSVIWKIVLVVELLGRSKGIGRQIHTQFSIFNVTGVLAYALSFIIIIVLIEFLILQPLERRATRWKNGA